MTDDELKALFHHEARMADHARIPAAGSVWWRAAMRSRADDVRAASRPILWFQAVAAAAVVGCALAVGGWIWPALDYGDGIAWLLSVDASWLIAVAGGFAACIALVPIVLYLALGDRR